MPAKRLPWVKLWLTTRVIAKTSMLSGEVFKSWAFLLMAAAEQPERGRFESPAHAAQCSGRPLAHVKDLISRGLLDATPEGLWVHDWKEHQEISPSDVSREGSAKPPLIPPPTGGDGSAERSAKAPHSSSEEGRGEKRDERPETGEAKDVAPSGASRARDGIPKPAVRVTVIDDPFIDAMVAEYGPQLGGAEAVRFAVENARGHKKISGYTDLQQYVRNWLRGDVQRLSKQRGPGNVTPMRQRSAAVAELAAVGRVF